MNRLRAFKKQKAASPAESPSDSLEKRLFRKKKPTPEPKAEIDVSNVLPSSEQFRTSLIMPNLSARFSMLRELDNPNTVIGKASDDSVLQPKRKSRLADFGAAPGHLRDIAEVSSIVEPILPDTAAPRKTSYTYGERTPPRKRLSMEDSIMNRARGDFPSSSPRSSPRGSPIKTPKKKSVDLLNDEPPKISPFKQHLKAAKEREKKEELEQFKRQYHMDDESWTQDVLASPKLSFDDSKRKTSSSTGSGPSHASYSTTGFSSSPLSFSTTATIATPATTTTSSPALPSTENRLAPIQPLPELQRKQSQRTYADSLAKHAFDQRAAALTRLTSIRRNPSTLARSGTVNIHRDNADDAEEGTKKARPQLDKLTTFDSIRRANLSNRTSQEPISPSLQSPPLSPFDEMAENINPLYNMVNANDRGKATAMGLFTKPDKFDERQYLQRQLSLMQQQRSKRKSELSPKKATFPGKAASPTKSSPRRVKPTMPRRGTDASDRSWTAGGDDVFTTARTDDKGNDDVETDSAANNTELMENIPETVEEEAEPASDKTLEKTPTAWSPRLQIPALLTPQNEEPPLLSDHPALRAKDNNENMRARRNGWSPDRLLAAQSASPTHEAQDLWLPGNEENVDPKQPKSPGTPKSPKFANLKGLVSTHLRHQSDASSIYPASGYVPSMYMSSPWESTEDFEKLMQSGVLSKQGTSTHLSVRPTPTTGRRILSNVTLRDLVAEEEAKTESPDLNSRHHARGGSSETQHERRAFADELAQRQRTIQENLKIKVDNESRSLSPAATSRSPLELPMKPFAKLRAKASRESLLPSTKVVEQIAKGYKWVDMAEDGNETKTETRDTKREPLSPGIGRTLHSKLKGTDDNTKKQDNEKPKKAVAEAQLEAKMTVQEEAPRSSKESSQSSSSTNEMNKSESGKSAATSTTTRSSAEKSRTSGESRTGDSLKPVLSKDTISTASAPLATPPALPPTPRTLPPQLTINTKTPGRSPPTPQAPLPPATSASAAPHRPAPPPPPAPAATLRPAPILKTKSSQSQLLRRRAHAYAHKLDLSSFAHHHDEPQTQQLPHIKKSDISEPTLIASTFPGTTVELPAGASLQNGMNGDIDVVLRARSALDSVAGTTNSGSKSGSGSGSPLGAISGNANASSLRPNVAVAMGRSVSAGVVKDERERERERKGVLGQIQLQPFLARVGRSVSAEKEGRGRH